MKTFQQFAMVISKVCECLNWIAEALFLTAFITSIAARGWMQDILSRFLFENGQGNAEISVFGFELNIMVDGSISMTAVSLLCVCALLMTFLEAMVFRNLYLILKTTMGKTSFSKGQTPFQKDNVRMVREIGIFYIAMSVVGFVMSIICRLILGTDATEISVELGNILTGIILLCLSETFSYGTLLQEDVEGLV